MGQPRVLLVEDNEELRRLYREIFRANNFQVVEAGDGQLAIDMALRTQPELIILDLMLPRQGGLGALRILRSLPECKHIPIFILTALPNPEYQHRAEGRVQGYFLKTKIKPQELVNKARELLESN
jgi:CheY-like chemotaxis protein